MYNKLTQMLIFAENVQHDRLNYPKSFAFKGSEKVIFQSLPYGSNRQSVAGITLTITIGQKTECKPKKLP